MNFVLSPRIMDIYYSDMYLINGKGCFIMGYGKSNCAQIASNNDRESEVGQDTICLSREGNDLFGHFEMSHTPSSFEPKPCKINTLVRCLSKKETEKTFCGKKLEILFIEYDTFFKLCRFFISFTVDPMELLRKSLGEKYSEYADTDQREHRFYDITCGIKEIKYLVLPWMPSVEEKSELLKQYA